MARSLQEQFWDKVDIGKPNECWPWKAAKDGRRHKNYGRVWMGKETTTAHRVAFILTYGDILPGMVVCHHCDNPCCCNPRHLFVETKPGNSKDMVKKGRQARGYRIACAKLSEIQVHEIRDLLSGGMGPSKIAKLFRVGPTTISAIKHGKSWAWLE